MKPKERIKALEEIQKVEEEANKYDLGMDCIVALKKRKCSRQD